jgi:hypothetical protein
MAPLDRARRVILITTTDHLEQVPRQIHASITSEKLCLGSIWGPLCSIIIYFGNLMVILDRAHRVVFGTRMNIWNKSLGKSVVDLLESGASFTYVTSPVFVDNVKIWSVVPHPGRKPH